MSGQKAARPDHDRERREKKGKWNVEKGRQGRTLEDMGAGSCQNIPYWKSDVLGLGMMGRRQKVWEVVRGVKDLRIRALTGRKVRGSALQIQGITTGMKGARRQVTIIHSIRWLEGLRI